MNALRGGTRLQRIMITDHPHNQGNRELKKVGSKQVLRV